MTNTAIATQTDLTAVSDAYLAEELDQSSHFRNPAGIAYRNRVAAEIARRTEGVEITARQQVRIAEVGRREDILRTAYPDLAVDFDAMNAEGRRLREAGLDPYYAFVSHRQHMAGFQLFQTASTEDGWWGGDNDTAFESYAEYIEYYR